MSAHCHCFEIQECPKRFCGTIVFCPRRERRSAAPGKQFAQHVREHITPESNDLQLELTDANTMTLPSFDADEMDQALYAHVSSSGVIRSINSGPKADVLMVKSHGKTIQTRFPHTLCTIVSALIAEAVRASCRKQATVTIAKHGSYSITAYPIVGPGGPIGATIIIKPKTITVAELARFIK